PYARGPVRSRKAKNIMNEVIKLVDNGFKEIVLTGIHVASYGKDLEDINLLKLLEMVHTIKGLERIRLSSIEPSIVNHEFVDTIKSLDKICPHFHLSLQSGCDETLRRMNRRYTTKDYKEAVELLRANIKDIAFTTDIIVGFPGESEEEFNKSYQFVEEIAFSQIHVFKYSPRNGTPAAKMKSQIAPEIKEERSRKMIQLANVLQNKFLNQQIGKTIEVLFEDELENNKGFYEGHTPNYLKVEVFSKEDIRNKILPVTIEAVKNNSLIANIKN
ncbi:MAG TPA: MiaB/RimO family radical SAM methylthiotransferase, partial [Defluviitaleaceae bacterium]|nr:MiaB/RimO family radical SAM methylthiotransferase [Defluviitaleaceae bacterium]